MRELKRFAVLRSWNPKNAGHGIADQYVLSGKPHNPAIIYPCFGSVISHQKGFKTRMPPFVQLGTAVDKRFGGGTAGYLGIVHNPFEILGDPSADRFSARDITPPAGIDGARLTRRRSMLGVVDSLQRAGEHQPGAFDALDKHYQAALNLITAPQTKRAFEIDGTRGQEQPETRKDFYFVRREGGPAYAGKTIEALRQGDWKLLQDTPFTPLELYNLKDDPKEATNLDITISGDGKFFYSLNATVGTVGVFAIQSNGTLTELDEIPGFTAAVGFNGIAAL